MLSVWGSGATLVGPICARSPVPGAVVVGRVPTNGSIACSLQAMSRMRGWSGGIEWVAGGAWAAG